MIFLIEAKFNLFFSQADLKYFLPDRLVENIPRKKIQYQY